MGQVAAGDDRNPLFGPLRRPLNALSQPVVRGKRKPGKTDPHHLIIPIILIQKPQRNHGSVIQPPVLLAHGPGGNIRPVRFLTDQPGQLPVIGHPHLRMRRTEAAKIPSAPVPGEM